MNIPFTDLRSQYQEAKPEIDSGIQQILDTNAFITGPVVDEFEQKILDYTGAEACASCGSGTTALQIALRACGIGPGDEVITPAHTFVATTEAICNMGAHPVFVDIDEYYHLDVAHAEERITSRTRAILFVDLYGQTPDIDKLKEIARKHNLYLIEDAAQSFGSDYLGTKVGALADITCVSFNPVKNLGAAGDAGCVLGRKDLVALARMYRDHGRQEKFVYEFVGYNARIDNMQAKIVQAKLPYLDKWLDRKGEICRYYSEELKNHYITPQETPWSKHTYYVYVLQTDDRDSVRTKLNELGISTNIHYPQPNNIQPAFKDYNCELPVTDSVCERIFSIPCYHSLSDNQIEYVINSLKAVL